MKYKITGMVNFFFIVLLTVIILFFQPQPVAAVEAENENGLSATTIQKDDRNKVVNKKPLSRKIIAYYFHSTRRCFTCKKFETLTQKVIQENFQIELGNGSLEWKPVNIDKNENKHFIKEFNLYTKAIVLVEIIDNKRSGWKNLDQIWQKVRKEDDFKQYIRDELKKYLKEK